MLCVLPMKRGQWEVAGVRLTDPPSSSKLLFAFTTPLSLVNSMARIHVRLLGPCYKTGGGATDLLGREMRTATENCSLYEFAYIPVRCEARTPRAASITNNFTLGLQFAPNSSCRQLRRKCVREVLGTKRKVIADQIRPGQAPPRLSPPQNFEIPSLYR